MREWKVFKGDIVGAGESETFIHVDPDDSRRTTYVARERVVARIGNRRGAFVLQHWGVCSENGVERSGGRIIAGSGTHDLVSIHGIVQVSGDGTGPHTLVLKYRLARE